MPALSNEEQPVVKFAAAGTPQKRVWKFVVVAVVAGLVAVSGTLVARPRGVFKRVAFTGLVDLADAPEGYLDFVQQNKKNDLITLVATEGVDSEGVAKCHQLLNVLYVFNDNSHDFFSCKRGGGNGIARPYNRVGYSKQKYDKETQ